MEFSEELNMARKGRKPEDDFQVLVWVSWSMVVASSRLRNRRGFRPASHPTKLFFFKEIGHFKFPFYLFIIFGCAGSLFLCESFLQLRQAGATLHRGARAFHYRGLSCCGAQAPDAQAQWLWLMGPAAPLHVGSSQTRARTRVPCIGRRTLNHCATSEAPYKTL